MRDGRNSGGSLESGSTPYTLQKAPSPQGSIQCMVQRSRGVLSERVNPQNHVRSLAMCWHPETWRERQLRNVRLLSFLSLRIPPSEKMSKANIYIIVVFAYLQFQLLRKWPWSQQFPHFSSTALFCSFCRNAKGMPQDVTRQHLVSATCQFANLVSR